MWILILRSTGRVLASAKTLPEIDAWHENWLDGQVYDDDNYPSCIFLDVSAYLPGSTPVMVTI